MQNDTLYNRIMRDVKDNGGGLSSDIKLWTYITDVDAETRESNYKPSEIISFVYNDDYIIGKVIKIEEGQREYASILNIVKYNDVSIFAYGQGFYLEADTVNDKWLYRQD